MFSISPPPVLYDANFVKVAHPIESAAHAQAVSDASVGLYSPTKSAKDAALTRAMTDGVNQILFGPRPAGHPGRPRQNMARQWRRPDPLRVRSRVCEDARVTSQLILTQQRSRIGALVVGQVVPDCLWHRQPALPELCLQLLQSHPAAPRARVHPVELDPFAATRGTHFFGIEHLTRTTTRRAQVHHVHVKPVLRRVPSEEHHPLGVSIPAPTHRSTMRSIGEY